MEEETISAIREANRFFVRGPIISKEMFIGRTRELAEALVMCQQVVAGATGGVLVYGGRGVGKTSFVEALRRELTARKIPNSELLALDDGMALKGQEYLFFKTLLSELVKTAAGAGYLDQSLGRRIIDALTSRIGLEKIEVQFPAITVVAKKGADNVSDQFPYIYFRDGIRELLEKIRAKNPGVGLFVCMDEGDILTTNRTLLQVLRNVFQHTPGAGIIVAGTYSLLEQVNDVFSPIPRFFQKVELGAFGSLEELKQAIETPIAITKQILSERKMTVNFDKRSHGGSDFVPTVERISERMPLDINMLCHYSLNVGARMSTRIGEAITVPLMINYEVMRNAISQLKGTRNYADFIGSLEAPETTFMQLLAQSDRKITPEELTLLIYLNDLGKNLQTAPVLEICSKIKEFKTYRVKIDGFVQSISGKAKDHKVRAISLGATGKAGIVIEDQWVRAYFKFSVPKIWDNLETSGTVNYVGIRIFGDPVASIVHSMFFPRLRRSISGKAEFRAHTGFGEGDYLRIEKDRKLLRTIYRRTADGKTYHLVFQVRGTEDAAEWLESIPLVMDALKQEDIVNLYTCNERRYR